ncbi:radical SAM protein, partial [Patescibacteria group bacterium]|nr:radical SAM protein [Patescibacteria group bacterium]
MVEKISDNQIPLSISPVIKAVSAGCNLRCGYCFYSGNQPEIKRMSDETLDLVISHVLAGPSRTYNFIWHGGEPTLLGTDFYIKAFDLQEKYRRPDQSVHNSIQTNATLLNRDWIDFIKTYKFGVGVSIDGPSKYHNSVRVNASGRGSFDDVMFGINLLKTHGLSFGGIAVVNSHTVNKPETLYKFIKEVSIPIALNPCHAKPEDPQSVKDLAVDPSDYYDFLTKIFELWITEDDPKIKIRPLDDVVKGVLNYRVSACAFKGQCNRYFTVDFNGDTYPCDEFLNRAYRLGSLESQTIEDLWASENFSRYYLGRSSVVSHCLDCEWVYILCNL